MLKVILPSAPRLEGTRQTRHLSRLNLLRQLSALLPTYILNRLKLMAFLNELKSAFFNANLLEQKLEVSM